MTPKTRLVVVAIGSVLVGGLLTGSIAYIGFEQFMEDVYAGNFYQNAADAQFEVRTLSKLRSGAVDRAEHDLDRLLGGRAIALAQYEVLVPPAKRNAFVYQALSEVSDYVSKYPADFDDIANQAQFSKALVLAKKARH